MSTLNEKIAAVMQSIGAVKNDSKHYGGYNYLSVGEVKTRCQVAFAAHGLTLSCLHQELTIHEIGLQEGARLLLCQAVYEISDGENSIRARGAGGGRLTNNKDALELEQITSAQSKALKCALQAALLIASDDDESYVEQVRASHVEAMDPAAREKIEAEQAAKALRAKVAAGLIKFAKKTSNPPAIRDLADALPATIDEEFAADIRTAIEALINGDESLLLGHARAAGVLSDAAAPAAETKPAPKAETKQAPAPKKAAPAAKAKAKPEPSADALDAALDEAIFELAGADETVISSLRSQTDARRGTPDAAIAGITAIVAAHKDGSLYSESGKPPRFRDVYVAAIKAAS